MLIFFFSRDMVCVLIDRWYQHFFQSKDNSKFHKEIKKSKISDWTFEVLETIKKPSNYDKMSEMDNLIAEREQYYIEKYNSVNEGYNSIISKKIL